MLAMMVIIYKNQMEHVLNVMLLALLALGVVLILHVQEVLVISV